MLIHLKVAKVRPNAIIPEFQTVNSAGADLHACLTEEQFPMVEIKPGETVKIGAGIKTQFAPGHVALICARSGISIKRGLAPANKVGVVDADYRGEWIVALHNHGSETQVIEDGDRIAQVLFLECSQPEFREVDPGKLDDTVRGEGGIGSTGK